MKVAGGEAQDDVVIGNVFDKYGSNNPIVKCLMRGYHAALKTLVDKANPATIVEVGCGEGYWVLHWLDKGIKARGTDFSNRVIDIARANATERGVDANVFEVRNIFDLEASRDSADLVICCEVLEHLDDPVRALEALRRVTSLNIIFSVPREPLWRVLNLARGKYVAELGNTPGHVQHWSPRAFIALVRDYFDVMEVLKPLPWTMLLCRSKPPY